MTYADFEFYTGEFWGEAIPAQYVDKWLSHASDELDSFTMGRLSTTFPTVEAHVQKVQKACCAIAEALYLIDCQRVAMSAQKAQDGSYRGAVASVSSGKESISYINGIGSSDIAVAAASPTAQEQLLRYIAAKYLAGVADANGVNILYGGIC